MAAKKKGKKKTKPLLIRNKALLILVIAVVITAGILLAVEYAKPGTFPFISWVFESEDEGEPADLSPAPGDIDIGQSLIVYFLDVGQGDSILLRFPDGTDILIDAGSGTSASKEIITAYLGLLSQTGLDDIEYMIATHPDSDHINMLDDALSEYEVEKIYYNGYIHNTQTFRKFADAAAAETYGDGNQAELIIFDEDGDIYTISGENYLITIYAPGYQRFSDANSMSPIIVVEYGGKRLILTGDAEEETEEWFMEIIGEPLDCDILKAGHHGSRTSSSAGFLDFITCEYAVISAGEGNTYNHPHPETLTKYSERNYTIYRTDLNGTIICYIDLDGDMEFVTSK